MKVFIVTEGGKDTGFGHITRCISLGQAFEGMGLTPEFIVNGDETTEILLKGKRCRRFNWLKNRNKLFKLVEGSDAVIIDSYLAGIDIYERLSGMAKVPVYIDDNKRLKYPKGIMVNGGVHAGKLRYPYRKGTEYLLGTRYVPLRKEFGEGSGIKIKKDVKSILITFGGVDRTKTTFKITRFLKNEYPELVKNVVMGNGFGDMEEIARMRDEKTRVINRPDAGGMKKVMLESDVAISAGGQTIYELAALGVPTIGIAVAGNQVDSLKEWQRLGFVKYTELRQDFLDKVRFYLKEIMVAGVRLKSSAVAKRHVDGNGASRVVNKIIGIWNRATKGPGEIS